MDNAENPYEAAHEIWEEKHWFYRRGRRLFLALSALLLGLTVLAWLLLWSASATLRLSTSVVQTDKLIPSSFAYGRTQHHWEPPVIRRELADFISRLRTIPNDRVVLSENLKFVFAHLGRSTPGYNKASAYINDPQNNPGALQNRFIRRVAVKSVTFQGGSTWLIEWTETLSDRKQPKQVRSAQYQGNFQLMKSTSPEADAISRNPLGLVVRDWTQTYLGVSDE